MTLYISDGAEEFRIEISGVFASSAVSDAATAWKAALLANIPRRISVDITRMSGYDYGGYILLREIYAHGTHIVAGTPKSLQFFDEISMPPRLSPARFGDDRRRAEKRSSSKQVVTMQPRAAASGE